jgi:Protein of unknown function (DUF3990)
VTLRTAGWVELFAKPITSSAGIDGYRFVPPILQACRPGSTILGCACSRGRGQRVAWINDNMVLYHGCSDQSLSSSDLRGIVVTGGPHNISHAAGAVRPDFGPGFYTTTWLRQARSWANNRVRRMRTSHPGAKAVVLRMRVERNRFANLQSLVFPSDRDNFYPFVAYCRGGGTPHAGLAYRNGPYDVIAGPVSVAGQNLVIGQADQVSFHTVTGTTAISDVKLFETGNPMFDVSE